MNEPSMHFSSMEGVFIDFSPIVEQTRQPIRCLSPDASSLSIFVLSAAPLEQRHCPSYNKVFLLNTTVGHVLLDCVT